MEKGKGFPEEGRLGCEHFLGCQQIRSISERERGFCKLASQWGVASSAWRAAGVWMQLAGTGSERNRKKTVLWGLAVPGIAAKSLNLPERPVPPMESLKRAGSSFCRNVFVDHFSWV